MRLSYLLYAFSLAIRYFSFVFIAPVLVALIYREPDWLSFLIAGITAFVFSMILKFLIKDKNEIQNLNNMKRAEGLCIVTLSWLFAGFFTSIPYFCAGINPLNSLFEAASGITATGATIFTHYNYSHSLLFWRSFSQWLGGMGIIVLFIAILPQFAIAGRQLFFAETPGPTEEKFTPRVKNTASALWKIYFGMTLIEIILLKLNGMSLYNSVCHSFSSVSGGGFSPEANGLIGCSTPVLLIICFFMFFAGANYNLQYKVWTKFNPSLFFKNEEFKTYFKIFILLGLFLSASLCINSHYYWWDGIKHAFFQIASIISTTGFCSVDFTSWDYVSKIILFIGMLGGSCASSAGGGIKIMRWLLVFKLMKMELEKVLHPKAVYNIKIGKYSVTADVLYQILMFVFFYLAIFVISTLLIAITEKNTTLALTSAISSIGNIGPGLNHLVGPVSSFDNLHALSKCIVIFNMYVGRLELIPFLILFQKDLWHIK